MQSLTRLLIFLVLAGCWQTARAGVEEAKKLIQEKNYKEVDAALADELKKRDPSPEALQLSFDAAMASGRFITAQRRATDLLKQKGEPDKKLLLAAADAAALSGEHRVALSRFRQYCTRFAEKSEDFRRAAHYLFNNGAYPDVLVLYGNQFGWDAHTWRIGARQFEQLKLRADGDRILEIATLLISKYADDGEKMNHLFARLWDAAERLELGNDETRYETALRLLNSARKITSDYYIRAFLDRCQGRLQPNERVMLALKIIEVYGKPVTDSTFDRLWSVREIEDITERLHVAKQIAALEPLYKAHEDKAVYQRWAWLMYDTPQAMFITDKEIINSAKAVEIFGHLRELYGPNADYDNYFVRIHDYYLARDKSQWHAFLKANLDVMRPDRIGWIQEGAPEGTDVTAMLHGTLAKRTFYHRAQLQYHLLSWYAYNKKPAELAEGVRAVVFAAPAAFDDDHIRSQGFENEVIPDEQKIVLLREIVDQIGTSPKLQAMFGKLANGRLKDNEEFKKLHAAVGELPVGKDQAIGLVVGVRGTADVTQAIGLLATLSDTIKRPIPAAWTQIKDNQDLWLYNAYHDLRNRAWNDRALITTFVDQLLPRLQHSGELGTLLQRLEQHGELEGRRRAVPAVVAAIEANGKDTSEWVWSQLIRIPNPDGDQTVHLAPYYAKMGSYYVSEYLRTQRGAWSKAPNHYIKVLNDMCATAGVKYGNADQVRNEIDHLHSWSNPDRPVPETVVTHLWTRLHEVGSDEGRERALHNILLRSGNRPAADKFYDQLMTAIADRPAWNQVSTLVQLDLPWEEGYKTLTPRCRGDVYVNRVAPLLASLSASEMINAFTYETILHNTNHMFANYPMPEAKAAAVAIDRRLAEITAAGGAHHGNWYHLARRIVDAMMPTMIEAAEWTDIVRLGMVYTAGIHNLNPGDISSTMDTLSNRLVEADAHEIAYVLADAASRNPNISETSRKQVLVIKSRHSRHIPELIPVPPEDPTYPLHEANQALSLGDEAKAWELTRQRLSLMPKVWQSLDIAYIAWTLEQMRKQKLLNEGLDFAFTVLLSWKDLEPEMAARVTLIKADIYRDLKNSEAARAEYESLIENRVYKATLAGRDARLHLIDLFIAMRDYDKADAMLQRLINARRLDDQAEAYYRYGVMSFDQQQYEDSRDYLSEVFKRKHDHVDARLLDGELKLKLTRGLINPEVVIGNPKLQTIAIPGKVLTLKIQDPNLSVARGGRAIPVVVTTSVGKDRENVDLLPSAADQTLFSGTIHTALGAVEPGNLQLEIRGDDQVEYVIDPEFQKLNDLSYPPKVLEVRSNSRLVASSGEILSEEEAEQRELQRHMEQIQRTVGRRLALRSLDVVRPGSPIYVQITDFDRDVSDQADKVAINLETTSGDLLAGFELTETEPHSGVFSGKVTTGIPLPRAAASDTSEERDPMVVINNKRQGSWASLADGAAPKWLEVDTMSSHQLSEVGITLPTPTAITEVALEGFFSDERGYQTLAVFPPDKIEELGGVTIESLWGHNADSARDMRLRLRHTDRKVWRSEAPLYRRSLTEEWAGKDGWMITRVRGSFYLPKSGTLEFKFLQKPSPHNWQKGHLFIDDRFVIGGGVINGDTIKRTRQVPLAAGVHNMEVLISDHSKNSAAVVGIRQDDGSFAPIPPEWFSVFDSPELLEALKPGGKIARTDTGFTATLTTERRYRKLRWQFKEFSGNQVEATALKVVDADGKQIIPTEHDFSDGLGNKILEISPGDEITVTYHDERRLEGSEEFPMNRLNASYYNGEISAVHEDFYDYQGERVVVYHDARRCRTGDQLAIQVTEYDEDLTDERDSIDIFVRTSSGEQLTVKTLETHFSARRDQIHEHCGEFIGTVKFGTETGGNTIKLSPGDEVTVAYLDNENTSPGVPIERTYTLYEAGDSAPEVTIYRTSIEQVEDRSPEAEAKRRRMGRQGSDTEDLVIFKDQIVATHSDFTTETAGEEASDDPLDNLPPAPDAEPEELSVSVRAPVLFEVLYPRMALHSGSLFNVHAVAGSELRRAEDEGREPAMLEVPMHIEAMNTLAKEKGYDVRLQSAYRYDADSMLDEGRFAGVIRLQVGDAGDAVDELVVRAEEAFVVPGSEVHGPGYQHNRVPTLLVSGSDTVHLRVTNEATGETVEAPLRLVSEAKLQLMDSTYSAENNDIHLGERFYIQLTDPDHDVSPERDTIKIAIATAANDKLVLTLTETLGRSGVFSGTIEPQFIGEPGADGTQPQPDPKDDILQVNFGDEVTFVYVDTRSLSSRDPVKVEVKGSVKRGADGSVAGFTKVFSDPEMAVKTRFLMAEALFEMAKEHRKLEQKDLADEKIGEGKRLLEEALRDYPDTSLVSQGEFLLANLAQELERYTEAIGRYSKIISHWPDTEYASRSQFKKAICLEKMGNYEQACEEYVKLTYLYPDSSLVADATVRLGRYYYDNKRFDTAGRIFHNFQRRQPEHELAPKALFLSGQCWMQQGAKLMEEEDGRGAADKYGEAIKRFEEFMEQYRDDKKLMPEAMYWLADSHFKVRNYVASYRVLKNLTWDYPETQWAKIARGRLTEEVFSRIDDE